MTFCSLKDVIGRNSPQFQTEILLLFSFPGDAKLHSILIGMKVSSTFNMDQVIPMIVKD